MRVSWRWSATVVAAGTGMLLASCSEPTTTLAPLGRSTGPALSNVVGSFGSPAGTLQNTIRSGDASVHYCGYQPVTLAPNTFTGTDCGNPAANLTVPLALFTPGDPEWGQPFTGSSWIGPTVPDFPSSDYRARPGTYEYVTSFTIPPGATNVSLQLRAMVDNALVAYLNGSEIGRSSFFEDCSVEEVLTTGGCNWDLVLNINDAGGTFNIGAVNVLRIDVINTRIGEEQPGQTPRATCAGGPGPFAGHAGFFGGLVATFPDHAIANWNASDCDNPTGLDFVAKIFFTPPLPLFVIGDVEAHGIGSVVNFWGAQWWKNNQMSGTTDPGYESFKGYASSADNFCGGVWSTQPGNSSDPPSTIPADVAIIVTTKVLKNGNTISGDIKQIVIVHQDGNYDDNPGHAGGGPVTQILCTRP